MAPRTHVVPRWAVAVSLSMASMAPWLPFGIAAAFHAAGWPQEVGESHGLVGLVYVAAALAIMAGWLPLGVSLLVMRARPAWSPARPVVLLILAVIALAIGTIVTVDALGAHHGDAATFAYLFSGPISLVAAGMATAMAWRLRTGPDLAP